MQTVILAGGKGTRIASVAGDLPKILVPVAGKPFVEHQFDLLRACGYSEVLLSIGYRGDVIRGYVGNGSRFGMKVAYVEESPDALKGTGGALVHALDALQTEFMLLYGDSYLPIDYRPVVASFYRSGLPALMTVHKNLGQWDASNARIAGDRVIFYSKKCKPGEADYIDYGLGIIRRDIIETYRKAPVPLDLAVIYGDLVHAGKLAAFDVPERFYEIGKPEGVAELEAYIATRKR
ncbi:MAG TPA: NTP transferase domain-containing protein [Kiritimatiellia bacterium]|nr:NTP transferase domain-containing protein [Kiritimatiellia bacterium]HMO98297.1 NTP transferase domain-containing protein [Kiritimatiellia bacterium]HMP95507.1 NTP transferase domain-containing protein [Kiritimatiellia bacterium]